MKKSFRKVLASLLAVLMIISSAPISALAYYDFSKVEGYVGYNELMAAGLEDDYINWDGSFQFFDEIYTDAQFLGDANSVLDQHPECVFTVSYMGTYGQPATMISKQYYGFNNTFGYEATKANIINPATLHEGDLIAITVECGGCESLWGWQFKGNWNPNYLEAGMIAGSSSANYNWRKATAVGQCQSTAAAAGFYGFMNAATGIDITTYSWNVGQSPAITSDASAVYVRDANTKFDSVSGLVGQCYTFRVLQDCDLKDVWTTYETVVGTYNPDDLGVVASGYEVAFSSTGHYNGPLPEVFTAYEKSAEETQQYTVTFVDAAGNTVSETAYDENTAAADVTVPDTNTAMTYDENGHTTYSWPEVADVTADVTYTEVATTVDHTMKDVEGTAVTGDCTTNSRTADQKCTVCDYEVEGTETTAPGHDYTGALVPVTANTHANKCSACDAVNPEATACSFDTKTEEVPAQVGVPGYQIWQCACGNTNRVDLPALATPQYTVKFVNAAGETVSETAYDENTAAADVAVPAANTAMTYDADGHTTYSWPAVADVTADVTYTEVATTDAHTMQDVAGTAVAADCTTGGKTADQKCADCDYTVEGTETPAEGHKWSEVGRTPATVKDAEVISFKCDNCDATKTEEGAAALGVNITIAATDLATVTVNGTDLTAGGSLNVPYGSDVTIAAADVNGEFYGWVAEGNKLVSNDAEMTVKAVADITYSAIVNAADTQFTVTFCDNYGNAISTQVVTDASQIVEPQAPEYVGYTFSGWDRDFTALTESAVITANYAKDASALFTVTATGCDINGEADVLTDVAYDTLVTVSNANAKAWKINGAVVAYGTSYSFFVGADVTVEAVLADDDTVTDETPVVAAVSKDQIGTTAKITFLATRKMTNDCKYISAGYIYGKNIADSELVLEMVGKTGANANAGQVKAYYCTTDSEQFSINYGVAAMTGTASARAFLVYEDAAGEIQVTYAAPQVWTY